MTLPLFFQKRQTSFEPFPGPALPTVNEMEISSAGRF
jgi:hypothetical protein